jgi:hypothetical protein
VIKVLIKYFYLIICLSVLSVHYSTKFFIERTFHESCNSHKLILIKDTPFFCIPTNFTPNSDNNKNLKQLPKFKHPIKQQ